MGSLGTRTMPANGKSSSRIMKIAQATEKAPAIRARVLVALDGASRLKPKKITTSQIASAISNGFETEGTACACSSARISASSLRWPCAADSVGRCVAERAPRLRRFRSVKRQHTIKQGDFRGHLDHFGSGSVEGALG